MASSRWWHVAAAAALSLVIVPPLASADVASGDRITSENVAKAKDLISPGLEWCIEHGFPIAVTETKRVAWPRAYAEADEKYAAQAKRSPDGLRVLDYSAGLPFPNIDPKDPQAAMKIIWNYNYGFLTTDDVDLRNFDADTGAIADHGPMSVERHFLLDPVKWDDKVDWAFDEGWENIDKEAWVIPFSDIHDRSGELWKIWINDFSFRPKAFAGANVIEYPDEMGFVPAINQGEKSGTVPEWFSVAAMVNAGH